MRDAEYLKQMIALNEKLENMALKEPFDLDDWHAALDEMHKINFYWYHQRLRGFNWSLTLVLFVGCVLCLLLLLIYLEIRPYGSIPIP